MFIYPTKSRRVTSKYGVRGSGFHNGVDFGAVKVGAEGDAIYASADGKVVISRVNGGGVNKGYGYYVIIQHDNGYCSLYAHLQKLELKVGKIVKQGEIIGHMGNTGNSTGVHLHFEIRKTNYNNRFFYKNSKGQFISSIDPVPLLQEKTTDDHTEIPSWYIDGFNGLVSKDIIQTPEYWKDKLSQPIKAGEVFAVINKAMTRRDNK